MAKNIKNLYQHQLAEKENVLNPRHYPQLKATKHNAVFSFELMLIETVFEAVFCRLCYCSFDQHV